MNERLSADEAEQSAIRENISKLIGFFENPFVQKKIDQIAAIPWAASKPIVYNDRVSFQV